MDRGRGQGFSRQSRQNLLSVDPDRTKPTAGKSDPGSRAHPLNNPSPQDNLGYRPLHSQPLRQSDPATFAGTFAPGPGSFKPHQAQSGLGAPLPHGPHPPPASPAPQLPTPHHREQAPSTELNSGGCAQARGAAGLRHELPTPRPASSGQLNALACSATPPEPSRSLSVPAAALLPCRAPSVLGPGRAGPGAGTQLAARACLQEMPKD